MLQSSLPLDPILQAALAWSGYLRRRLAASPALASHLSEDAAAPVNAETMAQWLQAASGANTDIGNPGDSSVRDPAQTRAALCALRERVFCTLMVRDLAGLAPYEEVVEAMTTLADMAVAQAYRSVATELAQRHGIPRDPNTGLPQEMIILGMGKLGGRELNVSSDIDLITLYEHEGETQGPRPLSHAEFYARVTRNMARLLADVDEHGRVFRTDLRLRPDGDAGPLAWNFEALDIYLHTQGREWERYAWIKARALPARAFEGSDSKAALRRLRSLSEAFIYRKYLDFDAVRALRTLRERIRQDWERRALDRGGLDTARNIKLGDGGIREIEFVVQLSQLIRGGRIPDLRCASLLTALEVERKAGLTSDERAALLKSAYFFLRRVEHLLQYREDEQTHLLPADASSQDALAQAFGLPADQFARELATHRQGVTQAFASAFHLEGLDDAASAALSPPPDALAQVTADDGAALLSEIAARYGDQAEPVFNRVRDLLKGARFERLPTLSRQRIAQLIPAVLQAADPTESPAQTATRLLDLIEAVAQRSAYLALLVEYPAVLARVARIMGASVWGAQYLIRHPLLLDSLLEWNTLMQTPRIPVIAQQLRQELDACLLPNGEPDIEQQMNRMRDLQHQITFQLLVQDLEGQVNELLLGDQLANLADLMLETALVQAWRQSAPASSTPRFAIIAYGKLGGKEMGYASDLDLVFLFDDPDPNAGDTYVRLSRRLSTWLSAMTPSGRLYEVDLRLRPDGQAGLLAVSVQAFEQYQRLHAWTWEHQALTRARFAAGDAHVGQAFEALRRHILAQPRDLARLADDIRAMRQKIIDGHPNPGPLFDIKHDRGGMIDVEFVTQYLVLAHGHTHPELLDNLGNVALLRLAARAGLIEADMAEAAAQAYRSLRRSQHAVWLRGKSNGLIDGASILSQRQAIAALWAAVLS